MSPSSYTYWSKQSTADIVRSLAKDQEEPLLVKADGTVMQGNTRLTVLLERGYNINLLPRVPYAS